MSSERTASAPVADVWSAQDTNPDAIEAALREQLRGRHAANQALAPARVLNLIVIVDRDWKGEIANRLEAVGRYHASRTILCAVEDGRTTLDAVAVMSYREPKEPGAIGVMHEHVEIDMGPEHLAGIETIVDPIVATELPTVLWSPHGHERAVSALLGMIDVMLIDSDTLLDPPLALARAAEHFREAYVVDLAWLRTTPWRERLAASFDPAERRAELSEITAVAIRHQSSSTASALLLAGWLAARLGWRPAPLWFDGDLAARGTARRVASGEEGDDGDVGGEGEHGGEDEHGREGEEGEEVSIELETVAQGVPGLAGVSVRCADGFSLSLDRALGGLCARESAPGDAERVWKVLGASRGEGGILGEGVRQALLRDPTYGPALAAARRFGT